MTKLVEAIAKSLVDNPDGVEVTETEGRQGTIIKLKVDPGDMGKVIGIFYFKTYLFKEICIYRSYRNSCKQPGSIPQSCCCK